MSWQFDVTVANNFDEIATTSIPRYQEVIEMCIEIAAKNFPEKNCRVLDVGSALGRTISDFYEKGFRNVLGVEKSEAMVRASKLKDFVIHSDQFPSEKGPFDFVCANWTLHFIDEREKYLRDIYNGLNRGGILILSDKMAAAPIILDLYHDFKRSNGLTEQQIQAKAEAIRGVLNPRPLEWYLQTLRQIGFVDVNIINAHFHFNTLFARKP